MKVKTRKKKTIKNKRLKGCDKKRYNKTKKK